MTIKDDITVTAGKTTSVLDVETQTTIKHATTGKVYADEKEADNDINDRETSTKKEDRKRDVATTANKLPDIFGATS